MEPGKTIRYNKFHYFTEGSNGIIMKNDESNTVIKLVSNGGVIVLYNLQHIKKDGDPKNCQARKVLTSLMK